MPTNRKLFVNLAVEDLDRSLAFFTKLGFELDEAFTDATAPCMLIGEEAYAMLLVKSRFAEFANKQIWDPSTHAETILGTSAETHESVDELVETALEAGGTSAGEPQEHGFMYSCSFHDPDGHHWEVVWTDPVVIVEALEQTASVS